MLQTRSPAIESVRHATRDWVHATASAARTAALRVHLIGLRDTLASATSVRDLLRTRYHLRDSDDRIPPIDADIAERADPSDPAHAARQLRAIACVAAQTRVEC
ncbi:hypothetical protein KEM52_002550 [Ascosphaera acerosa]|nr:hypothetical protein KEM52_002550 [Ascosphaera acerosa]